MHRYTSSSTKDCAPTSNSKKDDDDIYEFKISKESCGSDSESGRHSDKSSIDNHGGENEGSNTNKSTIDFKSGPNEALNKNMMSKVENVTDGKSSDDKKSGNVPESGVNENANKSDVKGVCQNVSEEKSVTAKNNDSNNSSNEEAAKNNANESEKNNDNKTDDANINEKGHSLDKGKKNDSGLSDSSAPTSSSTGSAFPAASSSVSDSKSSTSTNSTQKRGVSELETPDDSFTQSEEEIKRKRRKENDDSFKDVDGQEKNAKQGFGAAKASELTGKNTSLTALDKKSPCASPRPPKTEQDASTDETKSADDTSPKVPPLKIVIPQQNNGNTYVVATSGNNAEEKDSNSARSSPESSKNSDDKLDKSAVDEKAQQRILRSSHKTDRSSNNSSPQMQPNSPSATPLNENFQINQTATGNVTIYTQPSSSSSNSSSSNNNSNNNNNNNNNETVDPISIASPVNQFNNNTNFSVDINHPRKRKIRTNNKDLATPCSVACTPISVSEEKQESSNNEVQSSDSEHPANNYQIFLNIRKQIERKHRNLMPVQPKPPQGFKDYLLNRRTYVLAGKSPSEPVVVVPTNLPEELKDIFVKQEHDRYKLKMQHIVEKEKLVLSVEQEILRVHGRAARSLLNQSVPFSVCTILKDQEVYNIITPEQEEKERQSRGAPRGRLFLSWLQDVDDKWEKIKESMIMRHHNEAESLHAVQKMSWEWKMKELSLCEYKTKPVIENDFVPIVSVNDDFDLLPA